MFSFEFNERKNLEIDIFDIKKESLIIKKTIQISFDKLMDLYMNNKDEFEIENLLFNKEKFLDLTRKVIYYQHHYQLLNYILKYIE